MDYTSFVRNYYTVTLKNLKQFKHYFGGYNNLLEKWDIPNDFLHQVEQPNDFLPSEEVNINAPTEYFESFLGYLGYLMPDLSNLLLDKDGIKYLFSRYTSKNLDDEMIYGQINAYITLVCEIKKELGVLA